jgi:hypothetical protein
VAVSKSAKHFSSSSPACPVVVVVLRTCVPGAVKEDTKKKRTKDIKIGNHVSLSRLFSGLKWRKTNECAAPTRWYMVVSKQEKHYYYYYFTTLTPKQYKVLRAKDNREVGI